MEEEEGGDSVLGGHLLEPEEVHLRRGGATVGPLKAVEVVTVEATLGQQEMVMVGPHAVEIAIPADQEVPQIRTALPQDVPVTMTTTPLTVTTPRGVPSVHPPPIPATDPRLEGGALRATALAVTEAAITTGEVPDSTITTTREGVRPPPMPCPQSHETKAMAPRRAVEEIAMGVAPP